MRRIGHHRSERLAERARRALERETGQIWRIVSRHRADGRFSVHGHTFVFESEKPPPPPGKVFEWIVGFTYLRSGRSFDVIVTARDRQTGYAIARAFLREDATGQRIIKAGLTSWEVEIAQKPKPVNLEEGLAEFREQSERTPEENALDFITIKEA